jgi:hypothetical protein
VTYQSTVLADAPVNFWPLNDASGSSTVQDLGSSPLAGTPSGVTLGVSNSNPDTGNTCAQFNGTSSYISLPSGFSYLSGGAFTFECLANVTTLALWARWIEFSTGSGTNNVIWIPQGTSQIDYGVGANPCMTLGLWNGGSGLNFGSFAGTVTTGEWGHFALTVVTSGGTTTTTFYWNGVQVGQTLSGSKTVANTTYTTNYIGRSSWSADPYYTGYMQDMAIYNKALTAAQIASHAHAAGFYGNQAGTGTWVEYSNFIPGQNTGSVTFTTTQANDVVCVTTGGWTQAAPTSVTLDGVALTLRQSQPGSNGNSYLLDGNCTSSGSHTLTWNMPTNGYSIYFVGILVLAGAMTQSAAYVGSTASSFALPVISGGGAAIFTIQNSTSSTAMGPAVSNGEFPIGIGMASSGSENTAMLQFMPTAATQTDTLTGYTISGGSVIAAAYQGLRANFVGTVSGRSYVPGATMSGGHMPLSTRTPFRSEANGKLTVIRNFLAEAPRLWNFGFEASGVRATETDLYPNEHIVVVGAEATFPPLVGSFNRSGLQASQSPQVPAQSGKLRPGQQDSSQSVQQARTCTVLGNYP